MYCEFLAAKACCLDPGFSRPLQSTLKKMSREEGDDEAADSVS